MLPGSSVVGRMIHTLPPERLFNGVRAAAMGSGGTFGTAGLGNRVTVLAKWRRCSSGGRDALRAVTGDGTSQRWGLRGNHSECWLVRPAGRLPRPPA